MNIHLSLPAVFFGGFVVAASLFLFLLIRWLKSQGPPEI